MKKNKMMRIASTLLVAVLLTTSIISGTFAKYVTEGSVEDEARVAKFGVKITGQGSLFDKNYWAVDADDDQNQPGPAEENHDGDKMTMTVESMTDKVVAPGTKSPTGGLSIGITGKPEVDVLITIDFEAIEDVFLKNNENLPDMTTANKKDSFNFAADEGDYYPIVYTLSGDYIEARNADIVAKSITGIEISQDKKSVSGNLDVIKKVFDALNGDDGIYVDANTNLATAIGTLTLSWEWQFEDDAADELETLKSTEASTKAAYEAKLAEEEDATAEEALWNAAKAALETAEKAIKLRDQKDTLLGDLASGRALEPAVDLEEGTDYNLKVSLKLTITVTQVD